MTANKTIAQALQEPVKQPDAADFAVKTRDLDSDPRLEFYRMDLNANVDSLHKHLPVDSVPYWSVVRN